MQELKFEELTIEQKLGMVSCGLICSPYAERNEETDEHALALIRNHSLGSIWVNPQAKNFDDIMRKIKEAADYPILIFTDAESGLGDYKVGYHSAVGMANNEELAYAFGKVTAVTAREMGYNVVCNPILDAQIGSGICGANTRSMGSDRKRVAKLAAAIARGMHDGGVLTVGKHYPSATKAHDMDSHMAETVSDETEAELVANNLYPYLELMREDLLDGIMTTHCKMINIDPDYPTTLSEKVIDVIRKQGFDGFVITDAMSMMGVVAKFGDTDSKGMAIEAGNDISLNWTPDTLVGYDAICAAYKKGIISDAKLDAAVKRVLAAQHKVLSLPQTAQITPQDVQSIERIDTECIYARADEGLLPSISKDGKHYIIVLTDNDWREGGSAADVATFFGKWYNPHDIREQLQSLFPASKVVMLPLYPAGSKVCTVMTESVAYDDVVLISYQDVQAYIGPEVLTSRILTLAECLQMTDRISAAVHFGNPYTLEDLPHIPRVIIGAASAKSVTAALEVLGGVREAKGTLNYAVDLK